MPVQVRDLEKRLRIDEDALNEALIDQAEAFWAVSEELAMTISRRDEAKQTAEELSGRVDLRIRAAAAKAEEKTTETGIKSKVMQDKEVIHQQRILADLNSRVGLFTALKESFKQRGYALNNLVELHTTNDYNNTNSGDRSSASNRLKDQKAAQVKEQRRRDREDRD